MIFLLFIILLWLDTNHAHMFLALVLLMLMKFSLFSSNFLLLLLTLEALMLTSLILITSSLVTIPLIVFLMFFVLAVTEASLGLSLLISLARFNTSYFISLP